MRTHTLFVEHPMDATFVSCQTWQALIILCTSWFNLCTLKLYTSVRLHLFVAITGLNVGRDQVALH